MQILLINNDGAGFADYLPVAENLTLGELFARQCPGANESDYLIRVNRQPATRDQRLVEGDRVSITPRKIDGARKLNGARISEEAQQGRSRQTHLGRRHHVPSASACHSSCPGHLSTIH